MAGWSDSLPKQGPPLPLRAAMVGRGPLQGEDSSCTTLGLGPWKTKSQRCRVRGAVGVPLLPCHRQPVRRGCPGPFENDPFPLFFRCRPWF